MDLFENVTHTNIRFTYCNQYCLVFGQNKHSQETVYLKKTSTKQLIKSTPRQEEQQLTRKWKQGWFPRWWHWRTRPLRRTNSSLPTPRNLNWNRLVGYDGPLVRSRIKLEMRVPRGNISSIMKPLSKQFCSIFLKPLVEQSPNFKAGTNLRTKTMPPWVLDLKT